AERKKTDEWVYAQKPITLEHGIYYRLRLHYRTEMVVDNELRTQELFCVRFRNSATGKVDRGSFASKQEVNSRPDWTEWSHAFCIPEDCDTTIILELLLRVKRIGKAWFDSITVEPVSQVGYTVFPLKNNIMTYNPATGITYFMKLPPTRKESDYRLLVEAGGVKQLLEPKGGYAHGFFGDFPKGRLKLTATLLDMANKAIISIDESSLFVRDVETIPGRIVMEEDGRMLRDGKPYLPVGVYLGFHKPEDTQMLQRVKDAGFNSVEMVWTHVDFGGKKNTQTETLLAGIREMAKYGLTYLAAVKYQLPTSRARREKMDNVVGLENVTRHVINSIKREPNIVGWYVSDENPLSDLPLIRQLRELISELDPWHPTMTLTDKPNDFQHFAKTGDYIMHDSYPVGRHVYKDSPRQSMDYSHLALENIKKVGTPFVWVPQIFSWNSSVASMVPRYPTAQEVRSMALLGAIYDAKAYYFYSYHHIFYYSEKNDPGHSEEEWANASVGAKLISSLAPYFLSRETAPKVTVKQLSGKPVLARAFVHEGKTLVVITADGPDACEAEITVPGITGLKSRYGNTSETAPGIYKFKGLNIDSDVLSME
ncbi:MAG: hypothetical protein J6X55_09320, partial [Victivallales bacterium]|nr:hypothetical protein [Victivallales bacterium]